ncbi:MAG: lipoprotein [Bacteriovoracaceae bacterium]
MNFKLFILILIIASMVNACGVKGPPVPPPGTEIPPWEEQFLKPTPK